MHAIRRSFNLHVNRRTSKMLVIELHHVMKFLIIKPLQLLNITSSLTLQLSILHISTTKTFGAM